MRLIWLGDNAAKVEYNVFFFIETFPSDFSVIPHNLTRFFLYISFFKQKRRQSPEHEIFFNLKNKLADQNFKY